MPNPPTVEDCVAALDRLVRRHHALSEDEARAIGRLLTGEASFQLPAPAPAGPPENGSEASPPPS